jgi:hypothetical protein
VTVTTTANWTPLEAKLRSLGGHDDVIREFMWMYRDEDTNIEYYKHSMSRRYLLLHRDGRCFQYTEGGGLAEVDFQKELLRVRNLTEEDK